MSRLFILLGISLTASSLWAQQMPLSSPITGTLAHLSPTDGSPVAVADRIVLSDYESSLSDLDVHRRTLALGYEAASSDAEKDSILARAKTLLRTTLLVDIFPAWYGTKWDFNGYSNHPNQGTIACGYFVSTTLKHSGVHINRYRIAQMAASQIIEALADRPVWYRSYPCMMEWIKGRPDDLYVVGLDNHVGFISKQGDEVRFIHSSFVEPMCAMNESADESWVLQSSGVYAVGSLFGKGEFVRKWLLNTWIGPS
ncbi:hypothetical protein [Pontibacter sp. G13]|uniref:hypothetical protein n=1 Tax=Pontibacter sp. G13 TaxID=3074898 RepID=UPI00288B13E5|nr:hypothetical protein [Pontibacter sp. G13]WNJ16507.1 hypothetical protein RJD25_16700 [Pontibacter sp. G13]